MNVENIKSNVVSGASWSKILLMLLFALIAWLMLLGMALLSCIHTLIFLATGKPAEKLQALGFQVATYFGGILAFLLFTTETIPYPFETFEFRTRTAPEIAAPAGTTSDIAVVNVPANDQSGSSGWA